MFTLNNSIASKLPKTSEIKFIDIWIISGLLLHFIILILLILNEHLPGKTNVILVQDSKNNVKQDKVQASPQEMTRKFSCEILPLIEILFIIIYFLIAVTFKL